MIRDFLGKADEAGVGVADMFDAGFRRLAMCNGAVNNICGCGQTVGIKKICSVDMIEQGPAV